MSDETALSLPPSRSWLRERAIRATRLRLKRVEIETHRIKAELARLESANESDIADELTQELRFESGGLGESMLLTHPLAAPKTSPLHSSRSSAVSESIGASIVPPINSIPKPPRNGKTIAIRPRTIKPRKSRSNAIWTSVALHAFALLILAPMTFVIATHDSIPLFASMFPPASSEVDFAGTAPIELVSFDEPFVSDENFDALPEFAESVAAELGDLGSPLSDEIAATAGELNSLPTDVGTLMAGGGEPGLGRSRGAAGEESRLGRTSFFGTPAHANRVVFLVDNSASMKQGRMETTLFELARSVEALGEKQEFYVVFYSDQAYPMMYPNSVMQPLSATRENKQRLYAWLQTVELCVGGALLKAVEFADSLQPEVVYLLSDGDITGTKTMEILSQASDRKFAIHTLGMGVKKPQDAQNLARIAQANRGTFQMVGALPAAVQSAKARPLRSNPFQVAWGQGSFAGGR